ncbi:MAG: sugar ABC transporter substrate-binding protein [Anaerotignaceae bacterium]
MKKAYFSFFAMLFVLIFLFLASSTDLIFKEKEPEVYQISVLIDWADDTGWENFKHGLEKAASQFNVDFSFVTLYEQNKVSQQIELVHREIAAGAQGIIISSENLTIMEKVLRNISVSIPVVVVGSTIDSPRVKYSFDNNYEAVAQEVFKFATDEVEELKKITVATNTVNRNNVEIFCKTISDLGIENEIEINRVQLQSLDECETLVEGIIASGGGVLISPEINTLNQLGKAIGGRGEDVVLYGVGWSKTTRSLIENNSIDVTAVKNDYKVGYLSMKYMVEHLSGIRSFPKQMQSTENILINNEDMYLKENMSILFPMD